MTLTPQAHSTVGASSMYRWSACPGSVRLSEGIVSKSSVYADEGSDAHALGAYCLTEGEDAAQWVDLPVNFEGRKFTPTTEMAEAVQVYLDTVRGYLASDPGKGRNGPILKVEQRFDLSEVYPGCFGTSDATIWLPKTQTLIVIDYKHGAGIPVPVVKGDVVNPQLQYYGLGALLASNYPAKRVRLVIVQPRCGDGLPSEYEMDAVDLIDFRADLKAFAEATAQPDAPLVPGDHCRFCPAAAMCPALVQMAQDMARLEFSRPSLGLCGHPGCNLPVYDTPGGTACADGHGGAPIVQPPSGLSYDPEKLRLALDSREPLKAWLKQLDEFAYREAEAGRPPIGYKLVAKRATRKWRNPGEVVDALQAQGVKPEVFNEVPSLKSPTQLEKLIDKKILAPFIVSESSGHVLAPESDKRPAVKLDAKSEFGIITDDRPQPDKAVSIFD